MGPTRDPNQLLHLAMAAGKTVLADLETALATDAFEPAWQRVTATNTGDAAIERAVGDMVELYDAEQALRNRLAKFVRRRPRDHQSPPSTRQPSGLRRPPRPALGCIAPASWRRSSRLRALPRARQHEFRTNLVSCAVSSTFRTAAGHSYTLSAESYRAWHSTVIARCRWSKASSSVRGPNGSWHRA